MALNWFNSSVHNLVFGNSAEANTINFPTNITLKGEKYEMSSQVEDCRKNIEKEFQMPLHYPRYKKGDYEKMEEWKIDMVLSEYGLCFKGTLEEKRLFAVGAFLWINEQ